MEKKPAAFVGSTKPVELVSWYDAVRFCNKLSVKMGLEEVYTIGRGSEPEVITDTSKYGYRLPTEAEWKVKIWNSVGIKRKGILCKAHNVSVIHDRISIWSL